jgi:hypothetical protein
MSTQPNSPVISKWVTARTYANVHSFNPQTLANWRHQDRKAGLTQARPGYPKYARFGRAVRYLLQQPEAAA